MKTIYTGDVELAGVVQSEIDKAGLGDELEVRYHPWTPKGAGVLVLDGKLHSWDMINQCYAGLRVLL